MTAEQARLVRSVANLISQRAAIKRRQNGQPVQYIRSQPSTRFSQQDHVVQMMIGPLTKPLDDKLAYRPECLWLTSKQDTGNAAVIIVERCGKTRIKTGQLGH